MSNRLTADAVAALEERVGTWLLESPIRVREGAHRGGVLGWLSDDASSLYVYPEAIGYYLTTMRFMMNASPLRATQAMAALTDAFAWLERATADGRVPPTRVYLSEGQHDWRNDATFAFDCAIVARGLVAAADVVGAARARAVLEPFAQALRDMVTDDTLAPFTSLNASATWPHTWSTGAWVHHVKAVAALELCRREPWTTDLVPSPNHIADHWRHVLAAPVPDQAEMHPWLYGLEGLLLLGLTRGDRGLIEDAGAAFTRLGSLALNGWMPGTAAGGTRRGDVQAQTLRLAAAFHLAGLDVDQSLSSLALHALTEHITPGGAVTFALAGSTGTTQLNTWAALFAYQALALLNEPPRARRARASTVSDDRALLLLIA